MSGTTWVAEAPVALRRDVPAELRLADVFHDYLRDYIGAAVGRDGPGVAICPFVRRAVDGGVLYYAEVPAGGEVPPAELARFLVLGLAWFAARSAPDDDPQAALVVSVPEATETGLRTLAAAHRAVRPRVYDSGCTSAVFHADPALPEDPGKPWPAYFSSPAPFAVVRRIVPADLRLSMRAPGMFPAYHRLFAAEVRSSRLGSPQALARWQDACRRHGLAP